MLKAVFWPLLASPAPYTMSSAVFCRDPRLCLQAPRLSLPPNTQPGQGSRTDSPRTSLAIDFLNFEG